MSKYMGQVMAECDCQHQACEVRGYCMAERIEELETKLAKAVDAIKVCVKHEPKGLYPDHYPNYWLLKTTLLEL